MRTLNRPMFKYGGPIKEGIMQGMKDGGLSNNEGPRRAALVGNPVYPKGPDGRTGHVIPAIIGGGMAALRALPMIYRGFKTARTFAPGTLGTKARLKDIFLGSQRFRQGQVPVQGNLLSEAQIKAGMIPKIGQRGLLESLKDPKSLGAAIREYPFLALSTPSLATTAVTGGGPLVGEALKGVANFLVPGERFDPFRDRVPEKKEGDTSGLKRVDEIGTGEGTTGGSVTDDPNKAKQIQEDRIEKTKKRYYELMGLDKMKKDAAYDSLIDASKIVQEQGGDLKGAIKSGELQSSIINAISKNLDKSADIKRQIDAAILKGEIQKDIASADSIDKDLKKARIKQLERAEKNASASGQIAAVRSEKGFVPGATTAAILRNDGIKYDSILQDKLITDFKDDNPTKDEVDYIISLGTELPDGRYVVGERLVEKKGNEVAFIV